MRGIGGLRMSYEELVKELRLACEDERYGGKYLYLSLINRSADAIEELFRVAKKMHLWIFLNSGDEQEAYDWCGLSDEMNAALGYGGWFEIVVPKEKA